MSETDNNAQGQEMHTSKLAKLALVWSILQRNRIVHNSEFLHKLRLGSFAFDRACSWSSFSVSNQEEQGQISWISLSNIGDRNQFHFL